MTIQDLLIAWGKGRAISDPPNDFPHQTTFARLMGMGNVGLPPLPDEAQERVDRAVSDLKFKKPLHYSIVVKAYVGRYRDAQIAKQMRMSRSKARETRIAAEHWLEGRLDG